MNRERFLKVVLALVGLLFSAGIFPMVIMVRSVLQPHNESALPIALKTADEAMMRRSGFSCCWQHATGPRIAA
jgi:hypothetical protein